MDDTTLYAVFAFVWGAMWGSFLNVVIHRVPRGQSVVHPGSRCPGCERPIPWYDNVPLLSWLLLRGRCRRCGTRIAFRYFAVELLTALLALGLFLHVRGAAGPYPDWGTVAVLFLFLFAFVCAVVAVSIIDLELTLIPDVLTLPTAVVGVVGWALIPRWLSLPDLHPWLGWLDSLLGAVGSVAFLAAIFFGYKAATGRVGLGGGDFTMIAMIGAFLGWRALPFVFFLASVQGLLFAAGALLVEKVRGDRGGVLLRGVDDPAFWEAREAGERLPAPVRAEPAAGGEGADGGEPAPAEEDVAFGRMAIPFGPFLGLAALEHLFLGALLEAFIYGA